MDADNTKSIKYVRECGNPLLSELSIAGYEFALHSNPVAEASAFAGEAKASPP